ncbi:hypothetical protein [Kiloniella antarctica]|uniref:Uncharacterized protein n=1 Tax=Kiloniella antarctica TaxID=1550907 RepID=A0ABW5BS62_9PROT
MFRTFRTMIMLILVLSASVVEVGAFNHDGDASHHEVASQDTLNTISQNSDTQNSTDDCQQIFHCSSSNTLFPLILDQKRVNFFQYTLWSLTESLSLLAQAPTVDLRPPRYL